MPRSPIIGCTVNILYGYEPKCPSPAGCYYLNMRYVRAVEAAGGVPLALICTEDTAAIDHILGGIDGLMLTGGRDMDPSHFGEEPHPKAEAISKERTQFEIELARRARKRRVPTFGICLGMQTINVAMGGDLYQDIPSQYETDLDHRQDRNGRGALAHAVTITGGTKLHGMLGREEVMVNSIHHQAVRRIGEGLRVCAVSPDGIVEGLEGEDDPFLVSVQWHPEELAEVEEHRSLFRAFVKAARR
ncbi:MAG: gamma-glutamyl-gamma-aminobutyrate hydrolase family protein [Candidatus Wallbacteria bacterium]|nr:gamma-glutamyl-gamma-aminobutyrate hydrolase family protein [Candidatus Wallbacteria bacterium]